MHFSTPFYSYFVVVLRPVSLVCLQEELEVPYSIKVGLVVLGMRGMMVQLFLSEI